MDREKPMNARALCWRTPTGTTQRAIMSARAADRMARILSAIFPTWPAWSEAVSTDGDAA
jgi:hypothetical protein